MDGFRFRSIMMIALALGLGMPQVGWSQQPPLGVAKTAGKTSLASELTCKFYSLADIENVSLCKWITETIPLVIEPGSWNPRADLPLPTDSYPKIKCSPDMSIMVVRHTAEVHAQVELFLQNLRRTIAMKANGAKSREPNRTDPETASYSDPAWPEKVVARDDALKAKNNGSARFIMPAKTPSVGNVTPAAFSTAKGIDADAANKASTYLIPPTVQQPKHLFHMILRFEGSGMDTAVGDLVKNLTRDGTAATEQAKSETAKVEPFNQLFHFIIRYEGDGLIDASVVEFMKYLPKPPGEEKSESPPPAKKTDPLTGPTSSAVPCPSCAPVFGSPSSLPAFAHAERAGIRSDSFNEEFGAVRTGGGGRSV